MANVHVLVIMTFIRGIKTDAIIFRRSAAVIPVRTCGDLQKLIPAQTRQLILSTSNDK